MSEVNFLIKESEDLLEDLFKVGDKVLITGDVFGDIEGLIDKVRSDGYLEIKYPEYKGTDKEYGIVNPKDTKIRKLREDIMCIKETAAFFRDLNSKQSRAVIKLGKEQSFNGYLLFKAYKPDTFFLTYGQGNDKYFEIDPEGKTRPVSFKEFQLLKEDDEPGYGSAIEDNDPKWLRNMKGFEADKKCILDKQRDCKNKEELDKVKDWASKNVGNDAYRSIYGEQTISSLIKESISSLEDF